MSNRITQGMLNSQLLRNLNQNLARLDKLQNQLATGKKINKPSDDPVGISFSLRYRSELAANDQYTRNVDAVASSLSYTDKMLEQAGNVLHRVREIAIQGANGTNPEEALQAFKVEVDQMYEQMVNIGNSQFNGKYIFNGQMTDVKPYPVVGDAMNANPDRGGLPVEIGLGVLMAMNKTADQVFGEPGSDTNVFQILKDLSEGLSIQNQSTIDDVLGRLDIRMDKFLEARADVGAKVNRVELAEDRLKDIDINIQTMLSKTEDADMSLVITNLKMDENVYQASLAAGSKLIRPSLIDFLR